MTKHIETLLPDDTEYSLIETLKKGYTTIIQDKYTYYGLITKIDY